MSLSIIMGTKYTQYQSVELPPISQHDSVSENRGQRGGTYCSRRFWTGGVWIAAFMALLLGTLALMLFGSNTSVTTSSESLYSYVARLGSSHDTKHYSQHYHHDGKDFTKIVVIDKHNRGNGSTHKHDQNGNDKNETDNDKKSKSDYDWKQWVPNGKKATSHHHDGDNKNKHDGKSSKGDDDDDNNNDKGNKKGKSEYDWKKWVPDDKKKSSHDDGSKDGKQKHDKNTDTHEDKQQNKDKNAKSKVSDEKKKNASETKHEEQKNKHDGTKSHQNQTDHEKQEEETPFSKRAGEIYGSIKVNKTCTEAYNIPLFLDFGQLFNSLVNIRATQLTKHTYSFDFAGYPTVEYAQYNDAAMQLDVTIVDGFDVFKAFHEVFSFKEDDGGATCRVYRTQYLILADDGPVSWNDMEVEGKEELTALHKVFSTSNEPSASNGTGVDESPTPQASQDQTTVPPTALPTLEPTTLQPTLMPSHDPSPVPTPTPLPTVKPTQFPPTNIPTVVEPPTQKPTLLPQTAALTIQVLPTKKPIAPVPPPTHIPAVVEPPTQKPTFLPQTAAPTIQVLPTEMPTAPVPHIPTAVTSVSPKRTAEKEESAVAPES
jgi:hypothetical protein